MRVRDSYRYGTFMVWPTRDVKRDRVLTTNGPSYSYSYSKGVSLLEALPKQQLIERLSETRELSFSFALKAPTRLWYRQDVDSGC